MKKIIAKSLEAALIEASTELGCSVADLEYEVVQNPSNGFLGLGKKEAIIIVDTKLLSKPNETARKQIKEPKVKKELKEEFSDSIKEKEAHIEEPQAEIWGEQNTQVRDIEQDMANVKRIRDEIESLFSLLPFDINKFEVRLEDDNVLYVYIDGRDCALLIGERGYRYKALSYLLFNWINPKYGYTLKLEIAEFLKNQEEMIDLYLRDVVRLVELNGKAQTKVLDGVLVYIALNKLREIFPDKYVSVRQNEADEKYIIINDFRR
ncbi:Jag N-terminal domain-containing protein [Helicobacter marmotae]|uniref:RNA-binding protein KhpB N-terminal domain-containing protein n=1 Tax=Helicobacter marmotae TaxID=152490 RepID=A0A3D8I1A1_9HELI|nr:Jag N-terminal domain-containing protein [Helicobacter marmotae]RDU58913.1 hypothetical protein CQA63_08780 [Helicobacter marmotae]